MVARLRAVVRSGAARSEPSGTDQRCHACVSKAWKKSLSSVILRNLTCLEEIYVLGCRLEGRLGVREEARGKVSGAILSPGTRATDLARF